jgi:hypothetical protein
LGLAFLATAALWWLYFSLVATIAERRLALAENRTVLARDAYTYLHVVIVAGILLSAVGDELVIAHPSDELLNADVAAVVCGPALYLLAHVLLPLRTTGTIGGRRLAGALACLAIDAIGAFEPALVVAAFLLLVLVAVIVGDHVAAARRWRRGNPLRSSGSGRRGSGDRQLVSRCPRNRTGRGLSAVFWAVVSGRGFRREAAGVTGAACGSGRCNLSRESRSVPA